MMPLHPARVWLPKLEHAWRGVNGSSAALHCVQRAGEAMWLPAGWAHATRNLAPSIGVGGQAIWSAEARRASTDGRTPTASMSWLATAASAFGLGGAAGQQQDFFSHLNRGKKTVHVHMNDFSIRSDKRLKS